MATQVVVTRSGGFAGLVARAQAEVDDAALLRWERALDAAAPSTPARPDAYVYEVCLGERTAVLDEPSLPLDLRAMLDELFAR